MFISIIRLIEVMLVWLFVIIVEMISRMVIIDISDR